MAKASPKMKSTMGLTPVRKEINLDNIIPKTGPGIVVWDHQRANAAEAKLAAIETGKVKISDLYEVEGRKRSLTAEDFEQLKNNLTSNPLVNAIVVRARKQGGYEIISGHNRVQAYKELGRLEIEADIREFQEDQVFEAAFYSNLINSPLSDFEKYLGFKAIIEKTGETQKQIGEKSGVKEKTISRYLSFGKLTDITKEKISQNRALFSARLIAEVVSKKLDLADLVVDKKIANPEINDSELLKLETPIAKKHVQEYPKIQSIFIKKGGANFAKIDQRSGDKESKVTITFPSKAVDPKVLNAIQELLEGYTK